jgi:preprotein translocase subunit SecA
MINFISGLAGKIFGSKADRDIKEVMPLVEKIKVEFPKLASLSHDQLRAKSDDFRKRIQDFLKTENDEIASIREKIENTPDLDAHEKENLYERIDKLEETIKEKTKEVLLELLPEAFAVVKETAKRFTGNDTLRVTASQMDRDLSVHKQHIVIEGNSAVWSSRWIAGGTEIKWDMVHYDVQLIGGIALHMGKIAEMGTGEGKTLVGTLPVYLNALTGKGVHLVTVNNYLSRRDSEWMGPLFEFHGITVDCIDNHQPNSEARRKAYLADITYGTNNEFGFDYLRDNMARSPEDLVQRKHNFAIVDEVDSVLIDDARTPLIISGPTPKGDKQEFTELKPKIERLIQAQRNYVTNALSESKKLIKDGKEEEGGLLLYRSQRGLPKNKAHIKYLSEPGVKTIMQKTENFYMQDQNKEMHKVDAELFFVIDEKTNSIELTEKGIDLITGNSDDPEFFVLPDMGTKVAEIEHLKVDDHEKAKKKEELMRDFAIKSERIHTINQLLKAYTLFELDVEYVVIENKVKIVDEQTGRIMEGRRYSDGLHQAIEAKENVKVEAATQTYATITLQNYFRMYNKLAGMTGTAETEAGEFWDIYKLDVMVIPTNRPIARNDREDLVYKTAREKYGAVIEEIVKLTEQGRPVLVGTTSVEISELLSRMLKMKNIKHNVLNAKLHQREAEIVAGAGQKGAVTIATNMAGRGTDIKLGPGVKEVGGLAIIGTERHESRRVDRQLRGRAGRQGDPGSSQFFVSLEDNLMRLFGGDRMTKWMDRLGHKEGEVIQHSVMTKSIERAQKKVEENNFGTRKRLLEYDDVMNSQREVIYKRRRHALYGDRLSVDISNMIYDTCEGIVEQYRETKDFEGFKIELIRTFSVESPVTADEFASTNTPVLSEKVFRYLEEKYKQKKEFSAERAFPVIKQVYENEGQTFENIVIPFSDGIKTLNVVTNLKKAYETRGKILSASFEKNIVLAIIDDIWKEHLREMDELKSSVQNAAYEQKDPLLIYKFESFELFKTLLGKINREIVPFLFKGSLPEQAPTSFKRNIAPPKPEANLKTGRDEIGAPRQPGVPNTEQEKPMPVKVEDKIGRNDPCPCGSGKKYKNCHGA